MMYFFLTETCGVSRRIAFCVTGSKRNDNSEHVQLKSVLLTFGRCWNNLLTSTLLLEILLFGFFSLPGIMSFLLTWTCGVSWRIASCVTGAIRIQVFEIR